MPEQFQEIETGQFPRGTSLGEISLGCLTDTHPLNHNSVCLTCVQMLLHRLKAAEVVCEAAIEYVRLVKPDGSDFWHGKGLMDIKDALITWQKAQET